MRRVITFPARASTTACPFIRFLSGFKGANFTVTSPSLGPGVDSKR